jgi:AbrB family looped-hinge helix DNA binding protein
MVFDKWEFPFIIPFMNTKVTLDKAGRVVIPKRLRDALRLAPGDSLSLESNGNEVTLRPVRSTAALRKERGIWVFRGGAKLTAAETDRALQESRLDRDLELGGL